MAKTMRASLIMGLVLAAGIASAQVGTKRPHPMLSARPATVVHIKIHGKALEGNLKSDAWTVTRSSFRRPVMTPTPAAAIQ